MKSLNGWRQLVRPLYAGAVLTAVLTGPWQTKAQGPAATRPDLDLFGDDIVQKLDVGGGAGMVRVINPLPRPVQAVDESLRHTLVFYDGRQLRGRLSAITEKDIEWQRPDMSAPLKFARAEVRRIFFKDPTNPQVRQFFGLVEPGRPVRVTP